MVEEVMRLPGSSYDELKKVIVAYKNIGKDANLNAVAKATGMGTTVVSRNNGFLTAIGIIDKGQKKSITPLGTQLGQALEFDVQEDIAKLWRAVTDDNEFLRNLVSSVRIRKGMEANALRAHVAYSAGQSKSGNVMVGAGAIIEILKSAGAIHEQEGKLVAVSHADMSDNKPTLPSLTQQAKGIIHALPAAASVLESGVQLVSGGSPVSIQIQIQVNCNAEELEGLGKKLRVLLNELEADEKPDGTADNDVNTADDDSDPNL